MSDTSATIWKTIAMRQSWSRSPYTNFPRKETQILLSPILLDSCLGNATEEIQSRVPMVSG